MIASKIRASTIRIFCAQIGNYEKTFVILFIFVTLPLRLQPLLHEVPVQSTVL